MPSIMCYVKKDYFNDDKNLLVIICLCSVVNTRTHIFKKKKKRAVPLINENMFNLKVVHALIINYDIITYMRVCYDK